MLRRALGRARRRDLAEQLRDLGLGLEDRLDTPVGALSGGQRQALTLLMATLVGPELLLLDEHTSALDPRSTEQVVQLTEEIIRTGGLTTLMARRWGPAAPSSPTFQGAGPARSAQK